MTDLRKAAKGRECQIRIPSVCCGDPSTVVLCHFRMAGISGMGLKSSDALGAWGCFQCHQAVDRRGHMDLDFDFVRLCHLEGVIRTQAILIAEGKIKW